MFYDISNRSLVIVYFIIYLATCLSLTLFAKWLPQDKGREYAYNGTKSKGKRRGAGLIMIIIFDIVSCLFLPLKAEYIIYYLLIGICMIFGYLDDKAEKPWGEYKKGFFDLLLALITSYAFLQYNEGLDIFIFSNLNFYIVWIIATVFIWLSINATNCTDGVDGLSGALSIVTILSLAVVLYLQGQSNDMIKYAIIMCEIIFAYLWKNTSPSTLLMGDAGSRAIGFFIAILTLKTNNLMFYLGVAMVFILDGLIGLVKVSFTRFFKIKLFPNIIFPLHDFFRKEKGWSDSQIVFRFITFQVIISFMTIFLYFYY